MGLNHIHKRIFIDFFDCGNYFFHLITTDDRINDRSVFLGVSSFCFNSGSPMMSNLKNHINHCFRLIRHHKQCISLISLIGYLYNLCGAKLEDNGIQCSIPSKQKACNCKQHHIPHQNIFLPYLQKQHLHILHVILQVIYSQI